MRSISFTLLMLCVAMFASSCGSKSPELLKHIPANATVVGTINTKALMEKGDFEATKNLDFYKDFIEKVKLESPEFAKFAANPAESGLDMNSNAYGFFVFSSETPDNSHGGFILPIADKGKMEGFLKTAKIEADGQQDGVSFLKSEGNNMTIGHDGKALIFLVNAGEGKAKLVEHFKLSTDKSIAGNSSLSKALKANNDFHLWFNSNELALLLEKTPGADASLSMAGFSKDMFKDNYIDIWAAFEKGAIKSGNTFNLNDKLAKVFRPMFRDKVATDFAKYAPKANLSGYLTFAFDPKGFVAFLNKTMAAMMVTQSLSEFGTTLDGLGAAFQGDQFAAFYPSVSANPADMEVIFGIKIANQGEVDKIINAAKVKMELQMDGNALIIPLPSNEPMDMESIMNGIAPPAPRNGFLFIHDGILFFTTNKANADKIRAGGFGGEQVDNAIASSVQNHVFGMYYGYEWAAKSMNMNGMGVDMDPTVAAELQNFYKLFKDGTSTLDAEVGDNVINMTNKDQNALKTLIQGANAVYKVQKNAPKPADDVILEETETVVQ